MSIKYLVFISSTIEDLKSERRELVKLVTRLGALPVTMDAFDINNTDDQKLIKKAIGECDYFLNLTAYKAGAPVGKSFALETEFSWAERFELPVLSLMVDEKARWKAAKKEKEPAAIKALENLKKRLRLFAHETWTSQADLVEKAQNLLIKEMNLNPRQGWVPATEAIKPSIANELARLIQENETLKSKLRMEGSDIMVKVREQMRHALKVLAVNRISLAFWYAPGDNWENTTKFRYLRLFKLLAPELSTTKTTSDISRFLGNILNPDLEKTVRKDYPTPTNTIKKIMADLALLKLVKCSGSDEDEAWEITEYGKETYAAYRMHQLERILEKTGKKD
ncbi:DUF4062 domain-containing protein [Leadbettera azotonutricia]|uniref:DUF4062 domain-containing protein n=1 Tax=Leadbettera azotonutricia (strain ATCC BAA-888 / DSM 13862 / ZAS-9) TaxID=545695 RepID=F5YAJ2_LEAAZ|nr:DUF4062 domain-containing protein [Leadbettera azotonutricia]AEF80566.1 conserved hypothetical protein [Leadbettera azotonutricia ZAS-9]